MGVMSVTPNLDELESLDQSNVWRRAGNEGNEGDQDNDGIGEDEEEWE